MKTLALLNGMTFKSTALYYDIINKHVRSRLGPRASAPLFIYSANQEEMLRYAVAGNRDAFTGVYVSAAKALIAGGAEGVIICANLAHRAAVGIQVGIGDVPVLHIADFVAEELKKRGIETVGLLGMRVVMEGDCVEGRIDEKYGIEVLVPGEAVERAEVNKGLWRS